VWADWDCFSKISFFRKMASKHSVTFAEVLIRAALARRILVMANRSLSCSLTRFIRYTLVCAIIEASPDTIGDGFGPIAVEG
jgi:hypothetical protein